MVRRQGASSSSDSSFSSEEGKLLKRGLWPHEVVFACGWIQGKAGRRAKQIPCGSDRKKGKSRDGVYQRQESRVHVAVDADDAGLELKRILVEHLHSLGVEAEDLDMLGSGTADYPDIGYNLACRVANGDFDRGVLICGTGLGMAMVANKVRGVYAATCHDAYSAERLCKSNDGNVITLGARVVGPELAKSILSVWVKSNFEGGASTLKVKRMRELEDGLGSVPPQWIKGA